jgi:DNA mismatch endonuclease, patch repair protein
LNDRRTSHFRTSRPVDARSRNMRAVRGKHTKPELAVRQAAHALGLRYRLFRSDLPGRPDLTFPKWRTVLFVNGCFWHHHAGCPRSKLPETNPDFWKSKLQRNAARDRANYDRLAQQNWRVLILWECELAKSDVIEILKAWFPRPRTELNCG